MLQHNHHAGLLRWQTVTTRQQLVAARSSWDEVYARSTAATPFLSWEWQHHWWQSFGRDRQLAIILLFSGDLPVAVAPLCVMPVLFRGIPVRQLRFLGSDQVASDYLDFLSVPGFEHLAVPRFLELFQRLFDWDLLSLSDVPEESLTPRALAKLTRGGSTLALAEDGVTLCPWVRLPQSYDDYLASLSHTTRKEMRRKVKRFQRRFSTRLVDVHDERGLPEAIASLIRLNRLRRHAQRDPGAFTDGGFTAFHSRAIPDLVRQGRARIMLLYADERPVAVQYILCEGARWYSYQGGFEPRLGPYAPGTVLDALVLRHAIEHARVHHFDLLRGMEPYKFRLGARMRVSRHTLLFNNTPRAMAALALQRLIGAVRIARGDPDATGPIPAKAQRALPVAQIRNTGERAGAIPVQGLTNDSRFLPRPSGRRGSLPPPTRPNHQTHQHWGKERHAHDGRPTAGRPMVGTAYQP